MWFRKSISAYYLTFLFVFLFKFNDAVAFQSTSYYQQYQNKDSIVEKYLKLENYKAIYRLDTTSKKYSIYTFDDGCFNIKKCFTIIIHNDNFRKIILEAFLYNKYVKSGETVDVFGEVFDLYNFIQNDEGSQIILLSSERVIVGGEN